MKMKMKMIRPLRCCCGLLHGRLVIGGGVMGDTIICLSCGIERYEEHWWPWQVARAEPLGPENAAAVEAARRLPDGVNAGVPGVLKHDDAFDKWFHGPSGSDLR